MFLLCEGVRHVVEIRIATGAVGILCGITDIAEGQFRAIESIVKTDVRLTAAVVGCFGEHLIIRFVGSSDIGGLALEHGERPIGVKLQTIIRFARLDEFPCGEAGFSR